MALWNGDLLTEKNAPMDEKVEDLQYTCKTEKVGRPGSHNLFSEASWIMWTELQIKLSTNWCQKSTYIPAST